jgi:serine/threonine protein phosphatase PrpC
MMLLRCKDFLMVVAVSAGLTDVGRKRKGNQDDLILDDQLGLYVVADGMGGHKAGEVASKMVVDTVKDFLKRYQDGKRVDTSFNPDSALSREANQLLSSIHAANKNVHHLSETNVACSGMGATVAAIYIGNETLVSANVGDSPIYLVHNGSIEPLSVPHTVLAEQAALYPYEGDRFGSEFKHVLTRGMGIGETVRPDISEVKLFKDDILVIGSDGLSDKVSPEEICEVVTAKEPDCACHSLVHLANARGGDDNITVIVVKIVSLKGPENRVLKRIHMAANKIFTYFSH